MTYPTSFLVAPAPTVGRNTTEKAFQMPRPNNTDYAAGRKILVIDDEQVVRRVIASCLTAKGYEVDAPPVDTQAGSITASQAAESPEYDLLIVDLKMPFLDGLQLIKLLVQRNVDTPIMVTAGFIHPDLKVYFEQIGISQILQKPFQLVNLLEQVQRALRSR